MAKVLSAYFYDSILGLDLRAVHDNICMITVTLNLTIGSGCLHRTKLVAPVLEIWFSIRMSGVVSANDSTHLVQSQYQPAGPGFYCAYAFRRSASCTTPARLICPLMHYQKGVQGPCTHFPGCAKLKTSLRVLLEYEISRLLAGIWPGQGDGASDEMNPSSRVGESSARGQ